MNRHQHTYKINIKSHTNSSQHDSLLPVSQNVTQHMKAHTKLPNQPAELRITSGTVSYHLVL